MLAISPDKVAYVILKAREFDAKVGSWEDEGREADASDEIESILEDQENDATESELAEFIDTRNVDEQAALVALTWIGRGSYEPEEYQEAFETALAEQVNDTHAYLMGIPLLADYLEEGLAKMGYDPEDEEEDLLRPSTDGKPS